MLGVEWYVTPMEDIVKRELQSLDVADQTIDVLWTCINAETCGCSKRCNRERWSTCLRRVQLERRTGQ